MRHCPETFAVHASIEDISRVTEWTEAATARLDLPGSVCFAVQLCFEEAVSNIVRHGIPPGTPARQDLRVSLERREQAVWATVVDSGIAFDPLQVAPPAAASSIEDATVGGREST